MTTKMYRFTIHIFDTLSNFKEIETFRCVIASSHESAIRFGMKLWQMENGKTDMAAFSASLIQESHLPKSTWENYNS